MTDKEFKALHSTLKKLVRKWEMNLGFRHWDVGVEVIRDFHEDDRGRAAECWASWEYMSIHIRFYGQALQGKTEEELSEIVIHEFCHGIVDEMSITRDIDLPKETLELLNKHEERVVTMVTNALLFTYQDGIVAGKKEK